MDRAIARDLVGDIRRLDAQLEANKAPTAEILAATDAGLATSHGVGPVARPDWKGIPVPDLRSLRLLLRLRADRDLRRGRRRGIGCPVTANGN